MTRISLLLVLAAAFNSCLGNLSLKYSRMIAKPDGTMIDMLFAPFFILGMVFYGINVVLFAVALNKAPVSVAYPILAGTGFAMLVIMSAWLLGERIGLVQLTGVVVITLGIVMVAWPNEA